jgi:hypothetical protein
LQKCVDLSPTPQSFRAIHAIDVVRRIGTRTHDDRLKYGMGSSRPPNWSFAARAAYFGDQLCPFCDHRNPAGAKFCNECASPLHLKPCKRCDAVNHASATACYKCGAAYPAPLKPEPALAWQAIESEPSAAVVGATLTGAKNAQTPSRSIKAGQLVLVTVVTVLIASAYSVYRTGVSPTVAESVLSQPGNTAGYDGLTPKPVAPIAAQSLLTEPREHDASTAAPVSPVAVTPKPVESERIIVAEPTNVGGDAEATHGTATTPTPLPPPKHASAQQRSVSQRRAASPPSGAHNVAAARPTDSHNAVHAAHWEVMNVNLSRCAGDLIARIVCEQRVRQRFCEGRWGEVPECATGVTNEHRR